MKLTEARRDYYRKLSKEKGYRSRSAYKLIQLNKSYRILKPSYNVVDIGCAPGGWLQVAKNEVGYNGKVVGVDIKKALPIEGIIILQGNIEEQETVNSIIRILHGKANTILSDLSPNLSGIWDIDHATQISLSRATLHIARKILVKGGNAIIKVFEGELLKEFKEEVKIYFNKVLMAKPKASRQQSSELYMVCLGFVSN